MRTTYVRSWLLCALAVLAGVANAASDEDKVELPCTTRSNAGAFVDLRPLSVALLDPDKKLGNGDKTDSWHAKGYDYKANFTLNFCAPVVEELEDVVGIDAKLWRNVSAYYKIGGKTYSIGQESSNLVSRGRNIVLEYKGGSPCGESSKESSSDEDMVESEKFSSQGSSSAVTLRQKSTIISFLCDSDPLAAAATTSYVGTDPDECSYFFIVRSSAACGGAEPADQGVGPGGVFGIIAVIAVLVYFGGGIMYQRSVAHARGWRQLPNYSIWAGIAGFFQDMFIITTSSCARCIPGRRGYRSISVSADGHGPRGRNGRPDDENGLIDQLDEEWDD